MASGYVTVRRTRLYREQSYASAMGTWIEKGTRLRTGSDDGRFVELIVGEVRYYIPRHAIVSTEWLGGAPQIRWRRVCATALVAVAPVLWIALPAILVDSPECVWDGPDATLCGDYFLGLAWTVLASLVGILVLAGVFVAVAFFAIVDVLLPAWRTDGAAREKVNDTSASPRL